MALDGRARTRRAAARTCCAAGSTTDGSALRRALRPPRAGAAARRAARGLVGRRLGGRRPRPLHRLTWRTPHGHRCRLLVDALADHGVTQVCGVVGDALNPLTDAIRTRGRRVGGVRHEEAAAFAASAQSQLTGRLGGLHGHGRPRLDPPAQRPVRRRQESYARCWRSPARCRVTEHGQRLLPGGRQRRAVRRRGGLLPHRDQHDQLPLLLEQAGNAAPPGAGGRGADPARRRRRARPARRHRPAALRRPCGPTPAPDEDAVRAAAAAARRRRTGSPSWSASGARDARARSWSSPTGWPRRWC